MPSSTMSRGCARPTRPRRRFQRRFQPCSAVARRRSSVWQRTQIRTASPRRCLGLVRSACRSLEASSLVILVLAGKRCRVSEWLFLACQRSRCRLEGKLFSSPSRMNAQLKLSKACLVLGAGNKSTSATALDNMINILTS
jgi:hypothetical protein